MPRLANLYGALGGRYYRRRGRAIRAVARSAFAMKVRRPLRRYNPVPTFTETFYSGQLTQGNVGNLSMTLSQVPQSPQYSALYNQYMIKRLTWIIIPTFNSAQLPADSTAATVPVSQPRISYAINDSSPFPVPTDEQDVLTDNGCKIKVLNRPVYITQRPVAEVGDAVSAGGFVSETKKYRWLSFQRTDIQHGCVSYAIEQMYPQMSGGEPTTLVVANVYCKVTFAMRDPK